VDGEASTPRSSRAMPGGAGLGLAVRPARVVQAQWLIEQVLDGARMRLPD
jgi:hypothetical protein